MLKLSKSKLITLSSCESLKKKKVCVKNDVKAHVYELNYKSHIEYVTEMIMNISDSLRGWTAKSSTCNAQRRSNE